MAAAAAAAAAPASVVVVLLVLVAAMSDAIVGALLIMLSFLFLHRLYYLPTSNHTEKAKRLLSFQSLATPCCSFAHLPAGWRAALPSGAQGLGALGFGLRVWGLGWVCALQVRTFNGSPSALASRSVQ